MDLYHRKQMGRVISLTLRVLGRRFWPLPRPERVQGLAVRRDQPCRRRRLPRPTSRRPCADRCHAASHQLSQSTEQQGVTLGQLGDIGDLAAMPEDGSEPDNKSAQ